MNFKQNKYLIKDLFSEFYDNLNLSSNFFCDSALNILKEIEKYQIVYILVSIFVFILAFYVMIKLVMQI